MHFYFIIAKLTINAENSNLKTLLVDVFNQVLTLAKTKSIEFVIKVAPLIPVNLFFDRRRVGQICLNLLSNAIKFSPSSSTIKMAISMTDNSRLEELEVSCAAPNSGETFNFCCESELENISNDCVVPLLLIEIVDCGLGVDEQKSNILFTQYSQLDPTKAGTGLGLSICKQLVHLMNGGIGFKNNVDGPGATFYFYFPLLADESSDEKLLGYELHLSGINDIIENNLAASIINSVDTSNKEDEIKLKHSESEDETPFIFQSSEVVQSNKNVNTSNLCETSEIKFDPVELEIIVTSSSSISFPSENRAISKSLESLNATTPKLATTLLSTLNNSISPESRCSYRGINSMPTTLLKPYSNGSPSSTSSPEISSIKNVVSVRGIALCADDHVLNQKILSRFLKSFNCQYEIVSDGKECLEKYSLKPEKYSIIFMDCSMPIV